MLVDVESGTFGEVGRYYGHFGMDRTNIAGIYEHSVMGVDGSYRVVP